MMSAVQVTVRRARPGEEAARGALARRSLQHSFAETCLYFFCQELTLEGCVLGGAVLFIFCGAAPLACCAVLPAAAALVALAVCAAHRRLAERHMQALRGEAAGWVAEAPALARPPRHCAVLVQDLQAEHASTSYKQVVGTVSVSRHAAARRRGWLHGLHVLPEWRRRGVARALCGAARGWARGGGGGGGGGALAALEGCVSELQPAARACLHAAGWRLRGAYRRRVLGAAVTLPLAQMELLLPAA